ncbi:MAG: response regulator [Rhodothermales bacterium]|nr:response regulator [Rhodothermales bacterium]
MQEVFSESGIWHALDVAETGEDALAYLAQRLEHRQPLPELILLDLNLPTLDGREILARIKRDAQLCHIPVIVLTTSHAERDVQDCYRHHANCFITKPIDLDAFVSIMASVQRFWFSIVQLPNG